MGCLRYTDTQWVYGVSATLKERAIDQAESQ